MERCEYNTRLGHGTFLGKICTQYKAWAWYLAPGRYVHRARLGHGAMLGKMCTQGAPRAWYLAREDMYTSRDLCMVPCSGRYVH